MAEVMRSVGRYEIERELGRGGMARVFLARQTDLDRMVALKELSAFHASDPQFAQRFLRESRLAGSLSHPNIVTVHEYFEHEGTPYIAMEYVPRGSLRPYVGRLSLAQVVGVIEGILAGLAHAESKGVVHRDLKPENVMVTDEGRVKIADFGIAKASTGVATGAFLTATGTTVGTPAYMAPEQAMAQEIGPWTDLYSLGVMAYEMLVGQLPFPDTEAPMVLLMKQVNEKPPAPREVNPSLDEDLADWIERLLDKDPRNRPQNAADAWDELEESVIRIFGARWRREARLPAAAAATDTPGPLTPAPFIEPLAEPPAESDEFQSFAWNKAGAPAPPAPAPAVPETPPAAGPPTPPPAAVPAPPPVAEPALVAEGEPAAPVAEAEPVAPVAEAAAAAVVAAEAAAVAEPAAPAVEEPAVEEPPTEEAAVEEPAAEEPAAPADIQAPAEGFKTYGRRRPAPPPEPPPPPPEPAAEEPEEEPEEEWGATIAPARAPEPPPKAVPAAAVAEKAPAGQGRRIAIIAGAAVLAAVVAFLVAPSSKKSTHASAFSNTASAGGIELGFPATWHQAPAVPSVAGLPLTDPVALGGPSANATVVAGMSSATGPALLPQSFLARLAGTPGKQAVKLGPVAAYRYSGLSATSPSQRLTAYVVPTDKGVATVLCVGAAAVASPDCDAIAASMRLGGPRAYALGPSAAYAQSLGGALAKLNTTAATAGSSLASAGTPAAQAAAAGALAGAYRAAAATLRGLSVSPADAAANAALASALAATGRDYTALGAAAKRSDQRAYASAAAAVKRDAARAAAAQSGLKSLGYAAG